MYKQFLTYVPGNSFLHKLDPRTKIITLMILSILIFNTFRMWSLLSIFALFLIVSFLARLPIKKLMLSVKPMLFFIGIVFLLHFIFAPAPVFSDVSMSVKMMDDQLNNIDERFIMTISDNHLIGYEPVKLRYYEAVPASYYFEAARGESAEYKSVENEFSEVEFSEVEFVESKSAEGAVAEFFIVIEPVPDYSPYSDIPKNTSNLPSYFRIGKMTITKFTHEQIQEDEIFEYAGELSPVYFEAEYYDISDSDRRFHLTQPTIYQIQVAPEKNYFISPNMYSFMTGLGVALKFILLILFASLLAATTRQSDMIQGMERLVRPLPLKRVGITSNDLALMVFLTIRFIPLLISTTYQIKSSIRSRGFNAAKHPFKAIRIISGGLINSIINFADDVSRAMVNRGYTGVGKTSMNELKFTRRDGIFFCSFIFVIFSIIMVVGWIQFSIVTHI